MRRNYCDAVALPVACEVGTASAALLLPLAEPVAAEVVADDEGAVNVEDDEPPSASAAQRLDGLTIEEWRDRALRAEAQVAQFEETTRNG